MNENIDLTKILEGCPKGTKFYSSVFGEVELVEIKKGYPYPIVLRCFNGDKMYLTAEGRLFPTYNGECTLFLSRTQRDWSKFERFWDKPKPSIKKFDPEEFKKLEPVVVRSNEYDKWYASFFSFIDKGRYTSCYCLGTYYKYCIPYNEVTYKLIGTTNDCPDYYKWWEK